MCCEFDIDCAFLMVMTIVSGLIVAVDMKVLKTMFEEYFLLEHYMDHDTYQNCYKPQTEMRMVMEGFAIYCALLCTILTGVLALNLTDQAIDWVARKIVNLSFLMFGPVLFTMCLWGWWNFKGLSSVCGISGRNHHQFNGVCIFLLTVISIISLCVSYSMAMQKTIDMASEAFSNENSMLYRLSQLYFRYQQRLRDVRRASRRRDREIRRREDAEFEAEEQRLIQAQQEAEAMVSAAAQAAAESKKKPPMEEREDDLEVQPTHSDQYQKEEIVTNSNRTNQNLQGKVNAPERLYEKLNQDENGNSEDGSRTVSLDNSQHMESSASESEQPQTQAMRNMRMQQIQQRIQQQRQQQITGNGNNNNNKDNSNNEKELIKE